MIESIINYFDDIDPRAYSLIGGFLYLGARWAIQKTKKDLRKSKKEWVPWIYSELDEWATTVVGCVLFIPMGDGFLTSVCEILGNVGLTTYDKAISIYINNEELAYVLFGGLFGTILLNMFKLGLSAITVIKTNAIKLLKK